MRQAFKPSLILVVILASGLPAQQQQEEQKEAASGQAGSFIRANSPEITPPAARGVARGAQRSLLAEPQLHPG